MPRLSKFGFVSQSLPRIPESRIEIFQPTKGIHAGLSAQALPPGYTPAAQNVVVSGGNLTPRSGLSRFDATYTVLDAGLGGFEALNASGLRYMVGASANTFAVLTPWATTWSTLSYLAATGGSAPTGDYADFWNGSYIYLSTIDENIAVLTNARGFPKWFTLKDSTTTFSDFTWVTSLASAARAVCAFDNRLIFFNINSSASSYPQRVIWSDRGAPLTYAATNFADLMDMRGIGTAIFPEQDGVTLFTDREIWRGRKRGDAYAFDFYPTFRAFGAPYPRTIAATPFGQVFLGADFEVYQVSGQNIQALGPEQPGQPSRIQTKLKNELTNASLAWAVYNTPERRYELYYSTSGHVFANRALFYHFDSNSWFPQILPFDLSFGYEAAGLDAARTWDQIDVTWDQMNVPWDDPSLSLPGRTVVAWSSAGTPFQFVSTQTTDDATAIDARWRSHGLGQRDQFRFDTLSSVEIEFGNTSASSLGVHCSNDFGATFESVYTVALSASSLSIAYAPVFTTGQAPSFEVRIADGSRPTISRMQAVLRDAGAGFGGGL